LVGLLFVIWLFMYLDKDPLKYIIYLFPKINIKITFAIKFQR